MTRHPVFWAAYVALSAIALAIAWRLFPLAIPLVNLDIKLSRQEALARADALDRRFALSPSDSRHAARFAHDNTTQNYVELEGGGKQAFAALVAGDVYAPYWWEVRLFKAGASDEALVRFRPDGTAYGFVQKRSESFLPADPERKALDADAARRIAEERARTDWDVDLASYRLLEQTQQQRTNGRVDHAFVYERTAGNLAESRFRLRLGVTADALTEVTYFAHVPESFERRFVELRSANNTIAGGASLLAGALYGLGGCILGVLWLLRRQWLLWKPALAAGFVVGALMGAVHLADTPGAWFTFDTAQSPVTFWARQVGVSVLVVLGGGLSYGLVFMAAESLSRRAFGDHPQLWRVWSRDAAASRQVLGRTLGGYLFVPLELALIAAFYYATNRWLGWWQPSESLTDPNILGSAIPALMPIALSLQAGFSEECLFRAVPLSLAAIVGERFGMRRLAIGIAVIVQALIFGGAHANYPGFPSYSRLVELIVPSIIWALIFLRFGLLPTVILHALFDLALFSIPIFLVDAPGSNVQRALVIAAALVPLGIVLARRVKAGAFFELAREWRNAAWKPGVAAGTTTTTRDLFATASGWIAFTQRWLPALAAIGMALWLSYTPFHSDVPPLNRDRTQAEAAADAALQARGVALGPEWRRFAQPRIAMEDDAQSLWHRFVWREGGADMYRKLIGTVLAPPLWDVRYAKFEGDVAERAEEWRVTVNPDGTPRTVRHTLPENRAGPMLEQDAAQALAERELRDRFGLDARELRQIGAEKKQRPARADWTFTYADPKIVLGKEGEARMLVAIAGDEIVLSGRAVHVPEEWQRAEREREGRRSIARLMVGGVIALIGLVAMIMAVLDWVRGRVDRRALIAITAAAFVMGAAGIANRWPRFAMQLNTAEPIVTQVTIAVLTSLFAGLLVSLLCGLLGGIGAWAARPQTASARPVGWHPSLAGALVALVVAGVGATAASFVPRTEPLWPGYELEGTQWPLLAALLQGLQVLVTASIVWFGIYWLERITARFTRRLWLAVLVATLVATGAAAASGHGTAAAVGGAIEGLVMLVSIYAVLRFDPRTVPAYAATGVMLRAFEGALRIGTFDALTDATVTAAGALIAAWVLTRYIERPANPVIRATSG